MGTNRRIIYPKKANIYACVYVCVYVHYFGERRRGVVKGEADRYEGQAMQKAHTHTPCHKQSHLSHLGGA